MSWRPPFLFFPFCIMKCEFYWIKCFHFSFLLQSRGFRNTSQTSTPHAPHLCTSPLDSTLILTGLRVRTGCAPTFRLSLLPSPSSPKLRREMRKESVVEDPLLDLSTELMFPRVVYYSCTVYGVLGSGPVWTTLVPKGRTRFFVWDTKIPSDSVQEDR